MGKELPFGGASLILAVAGEPLLEVGIPVDHLGRPVLYPPPSICKEGWVIKGAVVSCQTPPSKVTDDAISSLLATLASVGVLSNPLEVVPQMYLSRHTSRSNAPARVYG